MDKKTTKQYEKLQSNIKQLLKDFEKNRQWADIGNWLSRLHPLISTQKFPDFPHKIDMAKRLAQCLNINLPAGIHSGALNIYNTILNNFDNKSQLRPLMSIGLFPFFEYSSSTLKLQLLKIFDKHFTNDHQCIQMVVSLMNPLLTGLNENNEELAKKIYAICDKISKKYGRIWVDGAVWVNILKSPKVRTAGFKYFMKSFKQRDKQKMRETEITQQEDKQKQDMISSLPPSTDFIKQAELLTEAEKYLFNEFLKLQNLEDDHQTRFPNFSSLVVNALSVCLEGNHNDNFVRRSALDLMIFYLKLDNTIVLCERDAIQLITVVLQILKLKQYSLTRRIYTYLFGQPDTQGHYNIQEGQRSYQLGLLQKSLQILLLKDYHNLDTKNSGYTSQGVLMIIQILLKDHEALRDISVPPLAYKILKFLRKSKINNKTVHQFYCNVIETSSQNFVTACLQQILKEQTIDNEDLANDAVKTIEYFYSLRLKSEEKNLKEKDIEITRTVQGLLKYLQLNNCLNIKGSVEILDLCFKLLQNNQNKFQCLSKQSLQTLNMLIKSKPQNSIYAGLLILHPLPSKQSLLPYINQVSLSIVCISNLLSLDTLIDTEIKALFFAIFNLFHCHLWQDQAIQFVQKYKVKYLNGFKLYIDDVEPTEWLTYWKKMNGDVEEGVIHMLYNLDNENPLLSHLSKKWVKDSKLIISKIVDPIYYHFLQGSQEKIQEKMQENMQENMVVKKDIQNENTEEKNEEVKNDNINKGYKQKLLQSQVAYKMLQNLFVILKGQFITYFFIQNQKYLLPLTNHIFRCIEVEDVNSKSQSLVMLQFLLQRATSLDEKITFLELTLEKTLRNLARVIQKSESYLREIQILSYFKSVADIFPAFKQSKLKAQILKNLIKTTKFFYIFSEGMKQTKVGYVRTLYIDLLLQYSSDTLAIFGDDKKFVSEIVTIIFDRLFIMLRQSDITYLEQIIRGKTISLSTRNRRRSSSLNKSFQLQKLAVSNSEFNVETKYAQIIQIWNMIKLFIKASIQNHIDDVPIEQLLSNILQSFPFSYLPYQQISSHIITNEYETLQEEIKNVTGLKKEVLQIFDTLWQNYQYKIINYLIQKGDPRILIHASVDPNAVVHAILNSKNHKITNRYYKQQKFSLPKGVLHYNNEILALENNICHFFYLYMTFCNLSLIKHKKVGHFVKTTLSLLKHLKASYHVQIKLWTIEIIYCLSERIPFRDIHLDNKKVKQQFQQITKQLLEELTYVATKAKSFTYKCQIKTGLLYIFSKQEKQISLFDFIKFYPPYISNMSNEYVNRNKNKNSDNVMHIQDQIQYFLFSKSINQVAESYIDYLSIVTFKTLTSIYMHVLINVYEQDVPKITQLIKEHLNLMLPLCEDKSDENQIYIENFTEFLHEILCTASLKTEVIKVSRKNIMDIFYKDDFFKCTKNALNHWKFIIDHYTESHDVLGEILAEKNIFEGIFKNKTEITRQKIKAFERVCFLIYAGRIDKYQNKLRIVLQSLIVVLKEQNPSPALLILILFCVRILFIRLSESTLTRIFRSIWPSLIALLIQIFTRDIFAKNNNLLLAGLKVVELVHALELQQFNIHKWIFIFDYFGIRLSAQSQEQKQLHKSDRILSPFCFKPILTAFLPPANKFKCSYIPEKLPQQYYEVTKRRLVIKESNIDNEEELRNHAFILLQYMIDLNQRRIYTVREEIEDIIEADFISLDDYIFQLK